MREESDLVGNHPCPLTRTGQPPGLVNGLQPTMPRSLCPQIYIIERWAHVKKRHSTPSCARGSITPQAIGETTSTDAVSASLCAGPPVLVVAGEEWGARACHCPGSTTGWVQAQVPREE